MLCFRPRIAFDFMVLLALGCGPAAADETSNQIAGKMRQTLLEREGSLIELRRDLHRHPELSGQEERTAIVIAERLRTMGLDVRTGVGGHGVVAVLVGGRSGPVVAYRADMDAIPTTGPDPVPFASVNEGVRHGCGHDMHMTVAVAIAEAFASVRDEVPGTVKFIFQPSEENGEGALAVIADGAMDDPEPQAIFALHCAPMEVGIVGSRAGMLLGGIDVVQVELSGNGDMEAASQRVSEVVGSVNTVDLSQGLGLDGGTDTFVMAGVFDQRPSADGDRLTLMGMVRASSDEEHARAKTAIEKGLEAIEVEGIEQTLTYKKYAIPPVMNDAALVERGNAVVVEVAGDGALYRLESVTPFFSEDFSHYQKRIPGAMYYLGVSNSEKGTMGLPHSPDFVADEGAIVFGADTMARILLDYLEHHEP